MSKNKSTYIHKTVSDVDISAYLPQLNVNDLISVKMKKLCQISVLSTHDMNSRERILKHIHSLFLPYFPDCKLVPFGSSVNGFGTKGCDMDLMFSPSNDYEHLDTSEINDDEYLPTIYDARVNPSVMAQLKTMSQEKQLRFLLRVLRRKQNKVKEAVFIPAKCTILRFLVTHNYHLWCDLSFHHGLARINSQLLLLFSELDSRVKPLMITLRFWAKHFKITGPGAFSSYAFSLLVIFFLQNKDILPSVTRLMIHADSHIVDGWEAGFMPNLPEATLSGNTMPEEELLKEFFMFYFNYDFSRKIICIRTGKATDVYCIKNHEDERVQQFKISDVCVQDPFDLSHNVSSSLKLNRVHLLKPYFLVAYLILSKQLEILEGQDTFQLLFDTQLYENRIQEQFFFRESDVFEGFYIYADYEIITAFTDHFEEIWFEKAAQTIRDILEYIFLFDCEVIDKDYTLKKFNFESNKKHGKLLSRIQCAVDNRIWKIRNTKNEDFPIDSYIENFSSTILKEENALSRFLLASNPALQCPEPFIWFLCNIYQSKYSEIPYIWINLVPLCASSEFKSICKVLKSFIPPTVKKIFMN